MEVKITSENLETYKNGDLPLVVDLWAPWCGPCKMLGPVISELAEAYDGRIVVGKNEGSRLVVVRKLGERGKAANAVSDVEVDIIDVLPSIAQGTAIDASSGPLSVEMHPEGPVIRHAEAPSGTITTQTLVKGDGVPRFMVGDVIRFE